MSGRRKDEPRCPSRTLRSEVPVRRLCQAYVRHTMPSLRDPNHRHAALFDPLLLANRLRGRSYEPPTYSDRLGSLWLRVQTVKITPTLEEFEGEIGDLLGLLRNRGHEGVTPEEEADLLKAAYWLNIALARARKLL
jgi:hypothetical protein